MAVYRAATKIEIDEFQAKAENWLGNQNPGNMFHDGRSVARLAVMEFLANKEGTTIYEGGVGRDIKVVEKSKHPKKANRRKPEPPKPASEPVRVLQWNKCMQYLEEKYGWDTDGDAYPVTILYYFLDSMDYIPKGNCGMVRIPWQHIKDMADDTREGASTAYWVESIYGKYKDIISKEEYFARLNMIIDTTIREFFLCEENGNARTYWDF